MEGNKHVAIINFILSIIVLYGLYSLYRRYMSIATRLGIESGNGIGSNANNINYCNTQTQVITFDGVTTNDTLVYGFPQKITLPVYPCNIIYTGNMLSCIDIDKKPLSENSGIEWERCILTKWSAAWVSIFPLIDGFTKGDFYPLDSGLSKLTSNNNDGINPQYGIAFYTGRKKNGINEIIEIGAYNRALRDTVIQGSIGAIPLYMTYLPIMLGFIAIGGMTPYLSTSNVVDTDIRGFYKTALTKVLKMEFIPTGQQGGVIASPTPFAYQNEFVYWNKFISNLKQGGMLPKLEDSYMYDITTPRPANYNPIDFQRSINNPNNLQAALTYIENPQNLWSYAAGSPANGGMNAGFFRAKGINPYTLFA